MLFLTSARRLSMKKDRRRLSPRRGAGRLLLSAQADARGPGEHRTWPPRGPFPRGCREGGGWLPAREGDSVLRGQSSAGGSPGTTLVAESRNLRGLASRRCSSPSLVRRKAGPRPLLAAQPPEAPGQRPGPHAHGRSHAAARPSHSGAPRHGEALPRSQPRWPPPLRDKPLLRVPHAPRLPETRRSSSHCPPAARGRSRPRGLRGRQKPLSSPRDSGRPGPQRRHRLLPAG